MYGPQVFKFSFSHHCDASDSNDGRDNFDSVLQTCGLLDGSRNESDSGFVVGIVSFPLNFGAISIISQFAVFTVDDAPS
jgi:hypothetical protein